jgi:photosystem II stability/assembly factor-like uncharacterized protein
VQRYDGTSWTTETTGLAISEYLYGLAAAPGAAAPEWAVGSGGTILRRDASAGSWSQTSSGTTKFLYDVWCASATEAWAVGDGGTILRWDGSAWKPEGSGTSAALNGVWGSLALGVWAVGANGVIVRHQ